MTDSRDRETIPPGSPCPFGNDKLPILDPGTQVISDLLDTKFAALLSGFTGKIDALSDRVGLAIDETLANQSLLRTAVDQSTRALEIARENQRRIEDLERGNPLHG